MKKTLYGLMVVAALGTQMQTAQAIAAQEASTSAPQSVSMSQKINLNTASQSELESLAVVTWEKPMPSLRESHLRMPNWV